jgi:DNA-binding PucR family transcriptional regulator
MVRGAVLAHDAGRHGSAGDGNGRLGVMAERTGVEQLQRLPDELMGRVRATVEALREEMDEVAAAVAGYCHHHIPELGDDEEMVEVTRATAIANMELIFWSIDGLHAPREIDPPHDAIEFTRQYARQGVTLGTLLRVYRLGHACFWRIWSAKLRDCVSPDEANEMVDAASIFLFAYIDSVCARLAEVHAKESVRWHRSDNARRLGIVREILAGELRDEDVASRKLAWRLDRQHVALIMWRTEHDGAEEHDDRFESVVDGLQQAVSGKPLQVWADDGRLWLWVVVPNDFCAHRFHRVQVPPDIRVVVGEPGAGLAGFASSHEQALAAQRVAQLTSRARVGIQNYRDLMLESLILADNVPVQRFLQEELGQLAEPSQMAARLRETLEVFLDSRQSPSRTASRLGLHKNTVIYRLERAAQLRGRPLSEHRLELETALRLSRIINGAEAAKG